MALFRKSVILKEFFIKSRHLLVNTECRNIARWVSPTLRELQRRRDRIGPEPETPRSSYIEWNYEAELHAFGPRLSENFKLDALKTALLHKSYKTINPEAENLEDSSQLIQQGELFITKYLNAYLKDSLPKYPLEGIKAISDHLMSVATLAHIAKHIGLKDIVLCAEFPVSDSTLSDAFKAVVAALITSSNEQKASKFIREIVLTQLNGQDINEFWNQFEHKLPSERLREVFTERGLAYPEARLCAASASETVLAVYKVGLYDNNKKLVGSGWGESVDEATQVASRDALMRIYDSTEERQLFKYTDSV